MAVTAFEQHQGFSPLELDSRWAIVWKETQPGHLTNGPKWYCIPYNVMFISKSLRRGGGNRRCLWSWHWSYQATIMCAGDLIFGKWLHIDLPMGTVLLLQASFDFLIKLSLLWLEVFLPSFYFCLVWWEKWASKRLGRGLAAGRSQPTTPSFNSTVPELFVHFVQWLFNYKMYKLFWVKTKTRIPLAALSGVIDIRLLNNSVLRKVVCAFLYIFFFRRESKWFYCLLQNHEKNLT